MKKNSQELQQPERLLLAVNSASTGNTMKLLSKTKCDKSRKTNLGRAQWKMVLLFHTAELSYAVLLEHFYIIGLVYKI